jgi:ribosome-binding factor A
MSTDRMTRVNELLKREIGEALFSIVHEPGFDFSAVTVTHVAAERSLREARVSISIRGNPQEQKRMMGLLFRHRHEIQQKINQDLTLKYTPRLAFELDASLEKGDEMLALLAELARERQGKEGTESE